MALPHLPALNDRYHRDLARVTVLRWFGIRADASRNTWNPRDSAPFLVVILSPLLLAVLHQVFGHPTTQGRGAHFFWLGYYVGMDLLNVFSQWAGCRGFHRALPSVDIMLTPRGARQVHAWIDRGFRPWRQEKWMLVGSAISCGSLFALSTIHQVTRHMYVDTSSYLTVVMSGAMGANSLFWLLRASRLARIITKPEHVHLVWSAPARTPGIEALSRWHRFVTLVCVFGCAVAFAPWVWLAPYVAHDGAYLVTKWIVATLALVALVLFGLYSQWRLSQAVLDRRTAVLHVLARRLPKEPPATGVLTDGEAQLVDLYDKVAGSPSGVIDGQTVATTLLTVAAVLVPLAVAVLVR
ncbi:hypothetical protein [Actinacidiphila acidipaludis]|uniref:Uncharacterized protein n=1 Tax=Actinacidiphila acidipaludis TaxID=2873382 RepID=A0ABS7PYS9_9ACTN|nr:hypothetical protein [Streptomyces acidipaludis]MBY8876041.1 hypothetical protein [Streptomyces acidipaludis]